MSLTHTWGAGPLIDGAAPRDIGQLIELGDNALKVVRTIIEDQAGSEVYRHAAHTLQFLPPLGVPRKNVFCVGRNYREHIIEGNLAAGRDPHDFPKALELFTKPPTAIVGHRAPVKLHAHVTKLLDYEIELGIVIGKRGIDIPREAALDYVFGYTIVNDITARDLQKRHGQWFKGKALDTSCPVGPYVLHGSAVRDPQAFELDLDVNGELRQRASTASMLFGVAEIIEQLSAGLTLEPGDLIATGTPSGVGFAMQPPRALAAGDTVRARIGGIGELSNTIVE
ncbi:fumarylacetoacetate hydrolase family protein [Paraburkholderia xenovorans]|uniref:fumarylacetoacetate hydrolase family protein n=1 Tax=Paraburkholderia xenovorans TaxID=36873 RepID=UPI001F385A46|nr:fumarylacetoacetate hydrolase family protein [Paraburkholderia xenovorans]